MAVRYQPIRVLLSIGCVVLLIVSLLHIYFRDQLLPYHALPVDYQPSSSFNNCFAPSHPSTADAQISSTQALDTATTGAVVQLQPIRSVSDTIISDILNSVSSDLSHEYTYSADIQNKLNRCNHANPNRRQYAVVTTITDKPTDAMVQIAETGQWCVVIVGDVKSPASFTDHISALQHSEDNAISRIYNQLVYLSVDDQLQLPYRLVHYTPVGSFSRKNIGFLVAMSQQPTVIYDFDDDNVFVPNSLSDKMRQETYDGPNVIYTESHFRQQVSHQVQTLHSIKADNIEPRLYATSDMMYMHDIAETGERLYWNMTQLTMLNDVVQTRVVNPYPQFGLPNAWPRGYPLEAVHTSIESQRPEHQYETTYRTCTPVVQQLGQGRDPDVDGVYRLTRGVPVDFMPFNNTSRLYADNKDAPYDNVLAVPNGVFTPYNAQCTMHLPSAYYSMLLPKTVHGRVADIWRSYIVQTLLTYTDNECVVFTPPHVDHLRNAHDYTRDFNSELPLYQQTSALLHMLQQRFSGNVLDIDNHLHPVLQQFNQVLPPALLRFSQLYIDLYEYGVLGEADVQYVVAWIVDLHRLQMVMPIAAGRQMDRAVCLMHNFDARVDSLWPLMHMQSRLHQHITVIADGVLTSPYTLPYHVHRMECASWRGHHQQICHAFCADYYTDRTNGLAVYNPTAAVQGILMQSDDTWVNYTQMWSQQYPITQAWLPLVWPHVSTPDTDVAFTYDWVHNHSSIPYTVLPGRPELGGFEALQSFLDRLREHPVYGTIMTDLYGDERDKLSKWTCADVYYIPAAAAVVYSQITRWLLTAPSQQAAVSFCEILTPTQISVAVRVAASTQADLPIVVRSPPARFLWGGERDLGFTRQTFTQHPAMIHAIKLSDPGMQELFLSASRQDWNDLRIRHAQQM